MSGYLPLVDGPCAGQAISITAISRNPVGTFLFKAADGSRHEYIHDSGQVVYIGPYDGPWLCDSRDTSGYHTCQRIVQPNEIEHDGEHECCCGKTW